MGPKPKPSDSLDQQSKRAKTQDTREYSSQTIKRIMQELRGLSTEAGSHPSIRVFPSDIISFWTLLMEGPDGTPYEKGVFVLYINFPPEYPEQPPEVRFVTPIYHCNINNSGRVCHSVFDRDYSSALKVSFVLQCVYGLLMYPAPDDPLDSVLAEEFLSNPAKYRANARALTKEHAKKLTMEQWQRKLLGEAEPDPAPGDLPPGPAPVAPAAPKGAAPAPVSVGSADDEPPEHLICPITFELFRDPVVNKYGSTYEKAAIIAHLQKNSHDPLTGQPLLPTDELYPSRSVKQQCDEWRARNKK